MTDGGPAKRTTARKTKTAGTARPAKPAPASRAPAKLHRWIDLLAALLSRHYPVAFRELARDVPAYAAEGRSPAALMRMFERDKDELRALGIPIETVADESGELGAYRLARRDFYLPYLLAIAPGERAPRSPRSAGSFYQALPTLAFEPDELAAIAQAAARVRGLGDPLLEEETRSAMRKLAVDLPFDPSRSDGDTMMIPQRPAADSATFDALDTALQHRKRVTFTYHAMSTDATELRLVEPYGLFFMSGHWYLAACDRNRGALRNFRLARIAELTVNEIAPGTPDYQIPQHFQLREHARSRHPWEIGDTAPVEVIVEVARDSGVALAAARLGALVPGVPGRRAFAVRRMDAFVRWMLSFGGGLSPVSPPDIVATYHAEARRTLAVYTPEGAP